MMEQSLERSPGGRGLAARLATNAAVQVAGTIVASGISFFTFVAVARKLGPAAYGDMTAALIYLFIPAVLADVGLTATVVRRIAGAPEETEEALGASLPLRGLIGVGLTGAFVALGYALPFNDRARSAILIASIGTLATLLNGALVPVFQARLQMHWTVVSTVTGRVVTLALTYGAIVAGLGFKAFVWAAVLGQVATLAITAVLVVTVAQVRMRPQVDPAYWRVLIRDGIVLGAALALGLLYFRVDTVLLALFRPAKEVGLYGASYKFLEIGAIVPFAVLNSLFPTLSRFLKAGDTRVRPLAQKAFDVGIVVSVPAMILGIAFAREIVTFTAGSRYAAGATALKLLAPYLLVTLLLTPALGLLMAGGSYRILLVMNASVLALNVLLNVVFIPAYGYKAAAVTSVASETLNLVLLSLAARRRMGFTPSLRGVPTVLLGAAAMVAVVLLAPGPAVVVALAAGVAYAVVVVAVPGTVRDVIAELVGRAST
jgi:O-antigen/teichoic acid export membrane protein